MLSSDMVVNMRLTAIIPSPALARNIPAAAGPRVDPMERNKLKKPTAAPVSDFSTA